MSIPFRNSRFNRSYLDRVATGGSAAQEARPANATSSRPATVSAPAAARRTLNGVHRGNSSVLEICHPEIARAITLLWGFPEMNEYFDRLWLADNAGGPIDPDAMSDLMLLSRVHQMLLPQRPSRNLASYYGGNRMLDSTARDPDDPWREVPERR